METSKNVALVLSSGGARGLAHIGVIEALLEENYTITSIAGSSMGAVIGAFYACGRLDDYKNWAIKLDRLDVFKLIDFTFSVQGFIRGEKVFKALEEFIPDMNIEDMSIPYCAVATDIHDKLDIPIASGSMYQAMKASIAIPTVIRPVHLATKQLIDGGVLNPVPVNHVKRNPRDLLVVSNVNAPVPYTKKGKKVKEDDLYVSQLSAFRNKWSKLLPGSNSTDKLSYFDLLNTSIDLMQDKIANLILAQQPPDIHVQISRDAATTFEFYKAKALIALGHEAFKKAKSEAS